jgi:hypothetical protein
VAVSSSQVGCLGSTSTEPRNTAGSTVGVSDWIKGKIQGQHRVATGTYDRCITLAGARAAGTVVNVSACKYGEVKQDFTYFTPFRVPGHDYNLNTSDGGWCLTPSGGTAISGSQIVLATCSGNAKQWDYSGGKLIGRHMLATGVQACLKPAGPGNDVRLLQVACADDPDQQWYIKPLPIW